MTLHIPFDNSYAKLAPQFYSKQLPTPVKAPHLIVFNQDLARLMSITPGEVDEMAQVFGGNALPAGAEPLAQLYAGHQFGHYNPQLGDGRALLLGETVGVDGKRRDLQLKGSGRTAYSRQGDGRAWLGPVLREYVVSEAMFALGIPTTRALAAVATGETVWRDTGLPGAVLTRVASSHLRVGSFQIFARRGDHQMLRQLTDYAIQRHYPQAEGPMGLLRAVRDSQSQLIAAWMAVGFIHGVMNTDNSSISGETIDYGPCAFMDDYDGHRVFSSIDHMGRYAYGNQPDIAVWNLAQLATSLIQQLDDPAAGVEEATEIVHAMPQQIESARLDKFRAKLGLSTARDTDQALITNLLEIMTQTGADFTNVFRALGTSEARSQFQNPSDFDTWQQDWRARLRDEPNPQALMQGANPAFIARNHRVEQMIAAAVAGDYAPFHRLNRVLSQPYQDQPDQGDLRQPPRPDEVVQATFCGT